MKVADLVKVPTTKPRNLQLHQALGGTKGGPMRDKKKEAERGKVKHKGKMMEDGLAEGRRHVYGPGDEELKDHPNKDMKELYKEDGMKVHELLTESAFPGEKLASYRDANGYTIAIYDGVNPGEEMIWSNGKGRKGTMFLTNPKGKTLQAGYWMDWPEKEWGLSDEEYYALPKRKRAALEAEQQGTKYDALEDNFKMRQDILDKRRHSK